MAKQLKIFFIIILLFVFTITVFGVSVSAKNTDVRDILRLISQQSGVNIIPDASVKGNIDVNIKDLTLEDALKNILEPNGYIYKKRGSVYLISIPRREGGRLQLITDGKTFTCDLKNADIKDVFKEVADQSKIDIVVYGNLVGTVDATLTAVPFEDGLNYLLGGTKYTMKRTKEGIYLVGDPSTQSPAAPMLASSELIRMKYLKADDIPDIVKSFSPNVNVKVIKEDNGIIVMGSQKEIFKVKEYISNIDIKSPVIAIDVLVVEYKKGYKNTRDFSLTGAFGQFNDLTMQPGSTSSQQGGFFSAKFAEGSWNTGEFVANLRYLISENKAKIVANPRISSLSGYPAELSVGQDEYYEVTTGNVETPLTSLQKIKTGVILKMTAWVTAEDEIILELNPEVSDFVTTSGSGTAATSQKNANTTLRVKDGETVIIGGLTKRTESQAGDRIPILGSIPIIGNLFSNRSKTDDASELVFYIRPTIIRDLVKLERPEDGKRPEFNWEDFRHNDAKKHLLSAGNNLLWTAIYTGTSLYFNKISNDYDSDWQMYGLQRDKDNAKYYAIGRDVTAGLGTVMLSVSLFDLYRYGIIKFKKQQKAEE